MRLDKVLAHYGIGTRKEVKSYIRKGFVTVNDEIIKKDDYKVDPKKDCIVFDGQEIFYREFVYLMLHKPAGYISATYDQVHPTVLELIEGYDTYKLFPVGRLDIDTEGLLIISNDGEFAHKILSPKRMHSKLYYARIKGMVTLEDVALFAKGVTLDTGYTCKPANIKLLKENDNGCEVEVEIFEGKFHQVKKMFQAIGKEVTYLKRTKMKSLVLDETLKLGEFRELTDTELVDLMENL